MVTPGLEGFLKREKGRNGSKPVAITEDETTFQGEFWGGRRESNPQQPEPQSGALPVELLPPDSFDYNGFGWEAGGRLAVGSRLLALWL